MPGRPFQNLENRQFGLLMVIGQSELRGRYRYWPVQCNCEAKTKKWVRAGNLLSKNGITSCGCKVAVAVGNSHRIHGFSATPTGNSWYKMISRCYEKSNPDYTEWGGRGIKVCAFLRASPVNLVMMIGLKPPGKKSIDRIANELHYSCGGCDECLTNGWKFNIKWSTDREQSRNKRNNIWITHEGRTQIVADWAKEIGVDRNTIVKRFKRGLPINEPIPRSGCSASLWGFPLPDQLEGV